MFFAIEEFIALGQTNSFTAAAARMGVSASHISRKVNALEQKLGVRLVHRTTRVVKLSDAGFEYFQKCLAISDEMEEANAQLISESTELEGRIRVSAAGDFAERVVAPYLAKFGRQHPKLRIEMDFNPNNINLVDDGFDFAIRYGELSDSSLVARKLTERKLMAAASAEYLKTFGEPEHPRSLVEHRCIVSINDTWRFIDPHDNNTTFTLKVPVAWQSNSAVSLVESAKVGAGICYLPETTLKPSIENQQLIPILRDYCLGSIPTWIVYPSRRYLPLRIRSAIDYLVAEVANAAPTST